MINMVMTKAGSSQPATEVRDDATVVGADAPEPLSLNDVASADSTAGVIDDAQSLVESMTGIAQVNNAGQGNVVTPRSK